jgi:hypothetical protein
MTNEADKARRTVTSKSKGKTVTSIFSMSKGGNEVDQMEIEGKGIYAD